MYHVSVKRVHATINVVEEQSVLHILNACVRACVALDIQHAVRMSHIFICGLPGSTTVFHIIS